MLWIRKPGMRTADVAKNTQLEAKIQVLSLVAVVPGIGAVYRHYVYDIVVLCIAGNGNGWDDLQIY